MRKYLTVANIPAIISLLALLVSLPAAVLLIQQQQFFIGKAAEDASLTLFAPQAVGPGQTFTVEIKLDTGNRSIPTTGTDVFLKYAPDAVVALYPSPPIGVLEPTKIIPGNTYDSYPIQEIDQENHLIKISGSASSLGNYFAGNGTFASIEFKALEPGPISLDFVWESGATDDTNIVGLVEGQPQERLLNKPASVKIEIIELILSWVNLHTNCDISNIPLQTKCDFSALAYSNDNRPIWLSVDYEWGISSENSIGSLSQIYGSNTQFKSERPGEGDIYVIARQGDLMEAAGRHLNVLLPRPSPYFSPTPSPSPVPTCLPEKLEVPFVRGNRGVTTKNEYQGCFPVTVRGVGQASGKEWSDAFYVYTDSQGNPLNNPIHYTYKYNWTLWINGQSAEFLIPNNQVPAYNSNHLYTFTVCLPERGQINFGVGDLFTWDNSGSYQVETCFFATPLPSPTASPLPSPVACTSEGQTMPVYPGYQCCPGLEAISPAKPDANGICPTYPPLGASVCARCGNGICGPGENKCNCYQDCQELKPAYLNFSITLPERGSCGFATKVSLYGSSIDDPRNLSPLGGTTTSIEGSGIVPLDETGKTYWLFIRTPSHLKKIAPSTITIQKGNNYLDFGSLIAGDLYLAPGENEQDNLINNFDVAELFRLWGPTAVSSLNIPDKTDFNCDNIVNTWDLKVIFENFGKTGDPS